MVEVGVVAQFVRGGQFIDAAPRQQPGFGTPELRVEAAFVERLAEALDQVRPPRDHRAVYGDT